MRSFRSCVAVAALAGLAGCASDSMASRDADPAPFPWCVDEARALASQPMPKEASREQRQAARDYHMSKACQKAYEQHAEVRFPTVPSRPR